MEDIMVSISCTTFNHVKFVRECLDGFLMQQCEFKFEVLLHDDASTDGTIDIINEYQQIYPDIIKPYIQKENQWSKGVRGMNAKYNFSRARGKYIAMCEGDDYWIDPMKLQKQVDFLENNLSFSACFTNAIVINSDRCNDEKYIKFAQNKVYKSQEIIKKGGGFYPTASLVFRKFDISSNFSADTVAGDRVLGLILMQHGDFYLLNDITCIYRKNPNGVYTSLLENESKLDEYRVDIIRVLKKFNLYTKYKYNRTIKPVISGMQKNLLLSKHHSAFKKESLKDITFRDWLSYFYNFLLRK